MVDQLPLLVAVLLLAAALVATQCLRRTVSPAPIAREPRRDLDLRGEATADLTSAVNHELRTPLCTIRGASEILLSDADAGGLTGDQRRLIESLDRNGRRLEAVVTGLGMLFDAHAHAPSGTVRVADVVRDALTSQEPLLADRRATVRLTGEQQDVVAHGSAAQLQLAVSQLLANAITFSPDPVWVDVVTERVGSEVTIRVSDHGVGIPPDELGSVFDWFYRGSASHTLRTPGIGLGLTVAKAVVEAHGGTLVLTSEEHRGTTATIALPIDRVPAERPSAAP